jgi:hypothetical protein
MVEVLPEDFILLEEHIFGTVDFFNQLRGAYVETWDEISNEHCNRRLTFRELGP